MKISFFGCGAGGNKIAIQLLNDGILNTKNTYLVNSTIKDIPEEYRDMSIIFSQDSMGGCGKERDRGKELLLNAIQNEKINLDGIIDPNDQMVVLCSSVEGGSGSASVTILAKYFKEVLGMNVCVILVFGFEDDIRGLQNSIEVCQELSDEYTIIGISNKKFLDSVNKNKIKAEKLANADVSMKLNILIGNTIRESEQNIDDTDLYKISTTPGYMDIGYVELPKIKNTQMFNDTIKGCLDDAKSLDITDPSAKRLGVIFTINKKSEDFIDFSSTILREHFGMPFEYFTHIQYTDGVESVAFIASGMDMPEDEIITVYNRYKEETEKVKKSKDSFFDRVDDLRGDPKDAMFNMSAVSVKKPTKADKAKFFESFGAKPVHVKDSKFSNTTIKEEE